MTNIAIVHFQPIEKYPPTMNLINSVCQMENISCTVFSTISINGNNWFSTNKCQIKRLGKESFISIIRYMSYMKFNILTLLHLILKKPALIIAYETYSLLPVFIYKKIFRNCRIHIHYHEYISPIEIQSSTQYYKFLRFFEKRLYKICHTISQTNIDRLELFLKDNPVVNQDKTFVALNLPPLNWPNNRKEVIKGKNCSVIKLVHIGSIGLSTMYLNEMLNWIQIQNGKFSIDFYSNNYSNEVELLFRNIKDPNIRLLEEINYFELPNVLVNYDIGVTLYNGHIPNYVFNIPNKVYEYLSCGLDVWYSKDLISTDKFNNSINFSPLNYPIPIFLKEMKNKSVFQDINPIINLIR